MTRTKISFPNLSHILSDKQILERLLTVLLDSERIYLKRPPTRTLPWQSVRVFPDIDAVDEEGVAYQIYIGNSGAGSLVKELQYYARQYDGDAHTTLHIILIQPDAAFNGLQSYCKLGPAVINTDGRPEVIGTTSVTYHVLSSSSKCVPKNAPFEIQQFLYRLDGVHVERPGKLLQLMDEVPYEWYWADGLRWQLKQTSALVFAGAIEAGRSEHEALIESAEAESRERTCFVRLGIEYVNALTTNFADTTPADEVARDVGVPVEMVEAVRSGHVYSEADLRNYYQSGGGQP